MLSAIIFTNTTLLCYSYSIWLLCRLQKRLGNSRENAGEGFNTAKFRRFVSGIHSNNRVVYFCNKCCDSPVPRDVLRGWRVVPRVAGALWLRARVETPAGPEFQRTFTAVSTVECSSNLKLNVVAEPHDGR